MSNRTLIVGDIHGCIKTFSAMVEKVLKVEKSDKVYLLGDYIDRGPDSKAVVDYIIDLYLNDFQIFPLRGNHEQLLLDSMNSYMHHHIWTKNGCTTTLENFAVNSASELDEKYLKFFNSLEFYYKIDGYILVHAGLNFSIANPLMDREAMLWTRNKNFDFSKIQNRKLIVGHTPTAIEEIKANINEPYIKLDAGCVYKNVHQNMGNLAALELKTNNLYSLENIENV